MSTPLVAPPSPPPSPSIISTTTTSAPTSLIRYADRNFSVDRVDSSECTNGVYLLRSKSTTHFVYKPRDEATDTHIEGIDDGEGYRKEVAAYVLDRDTNGFSRVPRTALAYGVVHDKDVDAADADGDSQPSITLLPYDATETSALVSGDYSVGSVQEFVDNDGSCEDRGWSEFDVQQVQNIAVLDIRIMNADRHLGNILVASNGRDLIPIDHGLSLPSIRNLPYLYWGWSTWKQAHVPFTNDTRAYIRSLTPMRDVRRLSELGINHESVLSCIVGNIMLKAFALSKDASPADVAKFVSSKAFHDITRHALSVSTSGKDFIKFGIEFANKLAEHLGIIITKTQLMITAGPPSSSPPPSPRRTSSSPV